MTLEVLGEIAEAIPPEWYNHELDEMAQLLARLDQRRHRVRELLVQARDSGRQPFLNWK
jgi:hypothetical protein